MRVAGAGAFDKVTDAKAAIAAGRHAVANPVYEGGENIKVVADNDKIKDFLKKSGLNSTPNDADVKAEKKFREDNLSVLHTLMFWRGFTETDRRSDSRKVVVPSTRRETLSIYHLFCRKSHFVELNVCGESVKISFRSVTLFSPLRN